MADLFQHGGAWRDWKITPAPAYVPDMVVYALGYFIFPTPAQRIAFVCVVQALLLAWAATRLATRIRPSLSTNARTMILVSVAFAALVSLNSSIWLFFNTTNNHFAALLFPLLCMSFILDFWKSRRYLSGTSILLCVMIGTASTPVFVLSFTLAALFFALICWFRLRAYPEFRKFTAKTAGLILGGQILASVLNALLISFNAFSGRAPMTLQAALNSYNTFVAATKVTFGAENPYTFAFAILGSVAVIWCVVEFVRRFQVLRRSSNCTVGRETIFTDNDWGFNLSLTFLLIAFPINVVGAVASGGFGDPWAYRYFSFPIALAWLLWVILLDAKGIFTKRKATFFLTLFLTLEAGLGWVSAQRLQASSGRDSYATLARLGVVSGSDALGRCIDQEARNGFAFDAGIADFWNTRGMMYATKAPSYILPISNDLNPLFHMMTIGPMMDPNRYRIKSYNFAILRKPGTVSAFDLTPDTVGKNLPQPAKIVKCDNTDSELWLYRGHALDDLVRKRVARLLLHTGRPAAYAEKAADLPGNVGRVQGEMRVASQGSDGAGYLIYGPYITLRARPYRISIFYTATQGGNKWDAGRFNIPDKGVKFGSGEFPVGEGKVEFYVEPKRTVEDVEIRAWFGGQGTLTVNSIKIETADSAAANASAQR